MFQVFDMIAVSRAVLFNHLMPFVKSIFLGVFVINNGPTAWKINIFFSPAKHLSF